MVETPKEIGSILTRLASICFEIREQFVIVLIVVFPIAGLF